MAHKSMRTGSLAFPMTEQIASNIEVHGFNEAYRIAMRQGMLAWEFFILAGMTDSPVPLVGFDVWE